MEQSPDQAKLSPVELFKIFFRAGWAFGGGLGILGLLETELVAKRRVATRQALLISFALGRIVPSGTMTAAAIAWGWRFAGFPGTVAALSGMMLPAFVTTVALTVVYDWLTTSPFFTFVPVTVVPAALAFIAAVALQLGRDIFRPSLELVIAVAAFALMLALQLSPIVVLLLGGGAGLLVLRRAEPAARGGAEPRA